MKKFLLAFLFLTPQVFADDTPKQTLMIKLKVADSHYELLDSWLLSRSYPATLDAPSEKELRWQLLDENHQLVIEGWIKDPQALDGALLEDNQSGEKVFRHSGAHRLDSADVILRVPYDSRIKTLQIERHPEIVIKTAQDSTQLQKPTPVERTEFPINPRQPADKK